MIGRTASLMFATTAPFYLILSFDYLSTKCCTHCLPKNILHSIKLNDLENKACLVFSKEDSYAGFNN